MTRREKRILKASEEFLEKYGLIQIVNQFLESEKINNAIQKGFEEQKQRMEFLRDHAPEFLKGKAEHLYEEFYASEEKFQSYAEFYLKGVYVDKFKELPEMVFGVMVQNEAIEKAFLAGKLITIKADELHEIINKLKTQNIEKYLLRLYRGYIPDLTERMKNFLNELTCEYVIIPEKSLIPEKKKKENYIPRRVIAISDGFIFVAPYTENPEDEIEDEEYDKYYED